MANTSQRDGTPDLAQDEGEPRAWIESEDGNTQAVNSPFEFGRSTSCACVLSGNNVSRGHAMLQFDRGKGIWWLSDLGSKNGTYRNSRKIAGPEAIQDGDTLQVGSWKWTFHEQDSRPKPSVEETATAWDSADATLVSTEFARCWLVLIDVVGSTELSRKLDSGDYTRKLRDWLNQCAEIVKSCDGVVNEFLGDAVYAFWRTDQPGYRPEQIAEFLEALARWREEGAGLDFRTVLHFGFVQFCGALFSGREGLAGEEVNYVFKCEKVIGKYPVPTGFTEAAAEAIKPLLKTKELCADEVPGFPGKHSFFVEE